MVEEGYNTVVFISTMVQEERRADICVVFPDGRGYQVEVPPLRGERRWSSI